jgi:hypothetical protein
MIATFLFGGEEFASKYAETRHIRAKGWTPRNFRAVLRTIVEDPGLRRRRLSIESEQTVDLVEWGEKWMETCKHDKR